MIAVQLFLEGVDEAKYEKIHEMIVSAGTPEGFILHTSGKVDGGWQVFDLWESRSAFETFIGSTLAPKMAAAGFTTKPQPKIIELFDIWTAGIDQLKGTESSRVLARA